MDQNIQQVISEQYKIWGKVIAQAWSDEDYKARLLTSPKAVLKEAGLNISDEIEVEVMQDTPKLSHVVLPVPPPKSVDDVKGRIVFLYSTHIS